MPPVRHRVEALTPDDVTAFGIDDVVAVMLRVLTRRRRTADSGHSWPWYWTWQWR
jgi:hypothetical protein